MAGIDKAILQSKFRGSLVGALLGDCLGLPCEGKIEVSRQKLQLYFNKLVGSSYKGPNKQYSDDTAMTKSIVQSLIENGEVDPVDLAKKFVAEYNHSPNRGYGAGVIAVFEKLLNTKFTDPFGPAKEQFDGKGSFGNGAAMRIAPIALFYHKDVTKMIEMSKIVSSITHASKLGINGAVLQCLAIQKCLLMDPENNLDVHKFADELIREMKEIEKCENVAELNAEEEYSYVDKLVLMQNLLKREKYPTQEEVVNILGHNVLAIHSVPTAIYSFLKAQTSIPEIDANNPFTRTIQYAISLGGDTDTIASMAGAIAGAYFGYEMINDTIQKRCEYINETIESADKLFEIASK